MDNAEIARIMNEAADLLELEEANPFRVRAYRNAARTVQDTAPPLERLVEEGSDLTALPFIGKDLAAALEELVRTGRLAPLDELYARVPRSLLEVMRIRGIGPKKARALWKELGIEDVDALEEAASAGRLVGLRGFGKRTEEKVLEGIEAHRRHRERMRLVDADRLVASYLEHMCGAPGLERIEPAGSLRRRRETVGDIDLVALASEAGPVMERFTSFEGVEGVEAAGATRGSVVLEGGWRVDLRIVPRESFGAALCYFTGSKAHNVALRTRAVRRGLRVSEYGVYREDGSPAAGAAEESGVYGALDLAWIPPELREDRGEIEAAAGGGQGAPGRLPDPLRIEEIRGDLQMHSTWSDGRDSLEEMLEGCVARGYEYFAITDHSASLAMTGGLDEAKLLAQWREIEALQGRHPGIRILRSLEVDILEDGSLDLPGEMLERLDLVVVSVHSGFQLPPARQTRRILRAIRHPAVNIFAHPTGRLLNRRDPYEYDLEEMLRAAAGEGVAVELNANPARLDLCDTYLMRARELGARVVISTDAHRVRDLVHMSYGVEQARRAWLERRHVANTLPLEELLRALGRDRG